WALYLLTAHADVQERLRAEVDAVDDIQQMPYLDAVIKETLRLYPPAWVFDRAPVEDLELGGYALRKDSTIYLSPWVAHRDARQFTEPARFDPMRFMPGWETRISRYAYFPFGTGPRNCIGRGLAEINAKVALAEMLRQVRFERGPGPAPKPSPAATLRPEKPLRLKVYRI
ncbi:MAG: cytochrome P450, partial [Stenotrophobium sp.]